MSRGASECPRAVSENELRTARLLLDGDLAVGRDDAIDLLGAARRLLGDLEPPRAVRVAQQLLFKLDRMTWSRSIEKPYVALRTKVLGSAAPAPPRFLIRVDEFPHARAWDEPDACGTAAYARFHEILCRAGVPYLLAVLPRVSRRPLDPTVRESRSLDDSEALMLQSLREDGVCFGLHGLDHRTRFASPRMHSELCGLDEAQTEQLLARGMAELAIQGVHPDVFVAPYNRFDAAQMPLLARRFEVVCGGPESIGLVGFQQTPRWWGSTVYLPSYRPFYGTAAQVLPAVRSAVERKIGLWVPVVLHWEWEARENWHALSELADTIAQYAADWNNFLAAVRRSCGRQGAQQLAQHEPESSRRLPQRKGALS